MELIINSSYISADNIANDDGLNRFTSTEDGLKDDYPNEMCLSLSSSFNLTSVEESSYTNNLHTSYTDALNSSDQSEQNRLLETWKMNYHEAAIYLQVFH